MVGEEFLIGLCLSEYEADQLIDDVRSDPTIVPGLIDTPIVGSCVYTVMWNETLGPFLADSVGSQDFSEISV